MVELIRLIIPGFVLMVVIVSCGCVSDSAEMPVTASTPIPAITPKAESIVLEEISDDLITVEVQKPTLSAEDTEQEWMYRTRGRYLGESFTIQRSNVSGYKDLTLTFSVYNYRFLQYYEESGADNWGTHHWWIHKAPAGQKFLFLFLREEMEGSDGSRDPRIWGFGSPSIAVTANGRIVEQDFNHYPCIAIRQMENTGNFNDDSRVSDFGKIRIQSLHDGKQTCEDLGVLRMGRSNQWDGYLIYLVPIDTTPDQIKVAWNFAGFGDAWWTLTKRPQ